VCPIKHCLYQSLSLNCCQELICIGNAEIDRYVFWGNLGVFLPVARTVNCGIYFVFRRIILEILCNILITLHIHTPCHIFLAVQQFFCHETNCSLTKLHVTPVSFRDSRTDSIYRFIPVRGIQLKTTAGPTAITNWIFRGSLTSGNTVVASVCVCVCAEGQHWVWQA